MYTSIDTFLLHIYFIIVLLCHTTTLWQDCSNSGYRQIEDRLVPEKKKRREGAKRPFKLAASSLSH